MWIGIIVAIVCASTATALLAGRSIAHADEADRAVNGPWVGTVLGRKPTVQGDIACDACGVMASTVERDGCSTDRGADARWISAVDESYCPACLAVHASTWSDR